MFGKFCRVVDGFVSALEEFYPRTDFFRFRVFNTIGVRCECVDSLISRKLVVDEIGCNPALA